MKGYEDEFNLKKKNLRKQKELEDAEDRKRLLDVGALERAERAKEQEKKQKLLQVQLDDLNNFNKKKQLAGQLKKNEDELLKNARNDTWGKPYDELKNNLNAKNHKIYDNASKFNSVLGNPLDPKIFNAKDDFEFNKLLAEQRAKQKKNNRFDPVELNERQKEYEDYKNGLKQDQLNNRNRQKLYKEYLDNQNELDKLNKLKNQENNQQQLLMPSYYYPNLPEPIYHKARDSILASKNQEEYFGKNMDNFFRGDAETNTLLDYEGNNRYLGDSRLRHNPITCPVNDYYYNKYVNKLKKDSEYIPTNNSSTGNNRDSFINNGQQIMK